MKDVTQSSNKRHRSPTKNLGWAEYDADILDNLFQQKRFAVNVSMASDLASRMTVGGTTSASPDRSMGTPMDNCRSCSGIEATSCTPVESSPCRTPKARMTCNGLTSPDGITPQDGELTMDSVVRFSSCKTEKRCSRNRPYSSPSDYQTDLNNLRKLALTRFAAQRSRQQDTPCNYGSQFRRFSSIPYPRQERQAINEIDGHEIHILTAHEDGISEFEK